MPHAVEIEPIARPQRSAKSSSTKSSKDMRQLDMLLSKTRAQYDDSSLSRTIHGLLESKNRPAVTKIVSLGLGSLKSTDQSRRLKQLTILLAIAEQLQQQNRHSANIEVYAQDPSFTKADEAFLASHGVHILTTPSPTSLGQAAEHIDASTLVYSPFLTLEAYELLFASARMALFVGDDFDALRAKWPKHSASHGEAEALARRVVHTLSLRRRAIAADDAFWDAEEKPFPMAMYWAAAVTGAPHRPQRPRQISRAML